MNTEQLKAMLPSPSVDSVTFWDGCDNGTLLLQRCAECSKTFYYARRLCPHCGSQDLSWEASSGTGTIFSFSEVHVSFFGHDWDDQLPYVVALIDLQEGPRMLSRLLLQPGQQPCIGDRANVVFVEIEGRKLPFFAL